jgi:serine/threonine-protein kinase ULK/ATG1
MTEIELLKRLKHRHIVELYDFVWDSEAIYLIMEYCSGGDLSEFIQSRKALPEKVARKFLQQLGTTFQTCETVIKAGGFLCASNGSEVP